VSDSKTRVALVGAGYIGDFHLEALRRAPGVEIVAVCDLARSRAERLAARAGGVPAFTDVGQMVTEARVEVVHVLTPPEAHTAPARAALAAGAGVLMEKPLAVSAKDCEMLADLAAARGLPLGVSHNFLFSPVYERLLADLAAGRLGRIDQLDIVWNKFLPQVQFGPFGSWLFRDPRHILFEVAPHSFAHAAHLVGAPSEIEARARDAVALTGGNVFYRHWDIRAWAQRAELRLRFSFIDGFTEHYLHVRGTSASAHVDFELNTYVLQEHSQDLMDLDRFAVAVRGARATVAQAGSTLGAFVLSKAGLPFDSGPYQTSITRAVHAFHAGRRDTLDRRLGAELATQAVRMGEEIGRVVRFEGPAPAPVASAPAAGVPTRVASTSAASPTVLVLGGSGFIGRALIRRLRRDGLGVRALVRDLRGHALTLAAAGAEVVRGDFTDPASVEAALAGIQKVYHLARGNGRTYDDYLRLDVAPTRALAELCAARGINLYYTSSIAIYDGGDPHAVITEETPPSKVVTRNNVYSRSKVENEKALLELHKERGLDVVIFRPGIVIGDGGSPYHFGVGAWPYSSICRVWGDGNQFLPFVLVDDCADAMVRALDGRHAGASFNLVGERCLTGNEYLDELERIAGISVQRLPVNSWRLFAEDIIKWGVKTLGRAPDVRRPSRRYYEGLSCRAQYSPEKSKAALGWKPAADRQVLVDQGIRVPVSQFIGPPIA
jgi:nucleoside-diphosphate-sugar epimerase/predicted dehydrogenase